MIIPNGKTDVTTYFVLRDSTNHAPKTDVTITDIDLYYVEELAAISAKADATALAAADSAHGDNQAYHVGQGVYRIDWPDAAFDGGVGKKVQLIVVCTGVDTTFLEVELSPAVNAAEIGGTTQTGRDLGTSVLLSSGTGTGQISLSSGAVLLQATQTGVTIPTVTNLTNAPTNGDLTATMKSSVTAAVPTAAQIKTAVEAAGSHLALILEDTGTTLDGKLNTIDTVVDLIEDITRNKLAVVEATGAATLYADDNSTPLLTNTITSSGGTTTRTRLE